MYKPKDILSVPIMFTDYSGTKKRPVLFLIEDNDYAQDGDFLAVPITGELNKFTKDFDFIVRLSNWRELKLKKLSYIRVNKLITINDKLVNYRIGTLDDDTWEIVKAKLKILIDCIS